MMGGSVHAESTLKTGHMGINMSIPIRFDWYDENGVKLVANRGCFTISYGQNDGDLTLISKRLQECKMGDHKKFIAEGVRYVVPLSAPDYMFDLLDPAAILPNKMKGL